MDVLRVTTSALNGGSRYKTARSSFRPSILQAPSLGTIHEASDDFSKSAENEAN